MLKLPDTVDIPCEIRNFCQAGLFLKLTEPGAEKSLPRERRDEAEVAFSAAHAESPFQLAGRLSHVTPKGVGFVFSLAPPFQVLLALQEKAMPPPPLADLPSELAEIHANCLQALGKALRPLADALPAQIQLELAGAGPDAPDGEPGQPPSSTVGRLEGLARPLVEGFYAHVLAQAKSFVVPDLSLQPEAGAIYSESQADRLLFEDWMNVIDKVIGLESKYEDILRILESRLSLMARREILNHDNPFGPNVLCHSFHYALNALELDNGQRNRVYEIFSRLLDEHLPKLYGDLRILSKSLDASKTSGEKKPEASYSHILTATAVSSPFKTPYPAEPGSPVLATSKPLASGTHEAQPRQQAAAKATQARPAAKTEAAPHHQPDAFSAFVLLFRYAESQANKSSAEPTGSAERAAIIAALRKLQANSPQQPPPYFNAPWLQAGLGQILAETGQEKALSSVEVRENLQILGLLLDAMLGDATLPPCVGTYIKRLQIPLLVASFADPLLMHGQIHPGREIFNQLDYLTQAANAEGEIDSAELLESLDGIFTRLSEEADGNPQAFAEALESLKKLTAPLSKAYAVRLERIAEACEGGQRLEQARRLVDREIDLRMGGKTVPAALLALLDAGWRQLLVLTNLRQGMENDDWRRQLAVVDLLLAWLGKKPPANPPSQTNIQGLIKYVQEKLPSIGTEPVEAGRALEKIEKLLLNSGDAGAPAYVDIPPTDAALEQKEHAFRNRLQGFRAGEWLKFASTRGAWIPLRLAWIGQNPGRYVFVNRKGVKTLDLDAAKFAQFLDEKRASRMENLDELSLVERTAKSLLSTLRDRLR